MDLSEIVAIPGMPGLFEIAGRRNDGLIVTSLVDGKTQFVSGRTNLFSTLDNITIYTTEDPIVLKEVLASIKKSGTGAPDAKDEKALKEWMEKILPNYDKEKVHVSDMKKLAKWYGILDAKNLVEELIAEKGDKTPITWLHRENRFAEKLATPDVTVADLIGDVDSINIICSSRGSIITS